MKKIAGVLSAAVAVLSLNGCGGGGDSYDHTYYLQTYDEVLGEYVGVEGVYYECDSSVGDTGINGEFRMRDGDICTFFDLDDTVSSEYNILYLGGNSSGTVGLAEVEYSCDSGISGATDYDGAFEFDPEYINPDYRGDICDFYFFE